MLIKNAKCILVHYHGNRSEIQVVWQYDVNENNISKVSHYSVKKTCPIHSHGVEIKILCCIIYHSPQMLTRYLGNKSHIRNKVKGMEIRSDKFVTQRMRRRGQTQNHSIN